MKHFSKKAITTLLANDFLGRDDSFVTEKKEGRLGWEKDIEANDGYSTVFVNVNKPEDLYKYAYQIATNMVVAMDLSQRVHLIVNINHLNATDGKQIFVDTTVFDEPNYTVGKRLDTFIGFAVHECSHCLFTHFLPASIDQMVANVSNIIEDERIEILTGIRTPGLAPFLKSTKAYVFGLLWPEICKEEMSAAASTVQTKVNSLVNSLLLLVRYPSSLTDEMKSENGNFLANAIQILTSYKGIYAGLDETMKSRWASEALPQALSVGYPGTSKEIHDAAVRLVKLIKETVKDELDEERQQQQGGGMSQNGSGNQDNGQKGSQNGSSQSNGDQKSSEQKNNDKNSTGSANGSKENGEQGDNTPQPSSSSEDNGNESDGDESKNDSQGANGSQSEGNDDSDGNASQNQGGETAEKPQTQTGKGNGAGGHGDQQSSSEDGNSSQSKGCSRTPEEEAKEREEIAKALENILNKVKKTTQRGTVASDHMSKDVKYDNMIQSVLDGDVERKDNALIIFPKKNDSYADIQYDKAYNAVKRYIPAVRNAIRLHDLDYDREEKCHIFGKLDTGRLVEAVQGVRSVYSQKVITTVDKACVGVLIDQSGSMDGCRIRAAREAAILLDEALENNKNVDLFVYGYDDNYADLRLSVYKEGKYSKKVSRKIIGSCEAHGGTPTGEAIDAAVNRIRKKNTSPCLLFVVTDGEPNNVRDTMMAIKNAEARGVMIVCINISGRDVSGIFKDAIDVNDIAELAPKLGKLVKKALVSKTMKHRVNK